MHLRSPHHPSSRSRPSSLPESRRHHFPDLYLPRHYQYSTPIRPSRRPVLAPCSCGNGHELTPEKLVSAAGFVVADDQTFLMLQQLDQDAGEPRIAVAEHAHGPGPSHGLENGCEAVHGNQDCRPADIPPPIEFTRDAVVIRAGIFLERASTCDARSGRRFPALGSTRSRWQLTFPSMGPGCSR